MYKEGDHIQISASTMLAAGKESTKRFKLKDLGEKPLSALIALQVGCFMTISD